MAGWQVAQWFESLFTLAVSSSESEKKTHWKVWSEDDEVRQAHHRPFKSCSGHDCGQKLRQQEVGLKHNVLIKSCMKVTLE